jgi:polar amino acid transport system permease protein
VNVISENWIYLLRAAENTVWLSAISIAISLVLGTLIGVLASFRVFPFALINQIGVVLVRGIPLLVILYFVYFSLPLLKVFIDPYPTAIIGLSLYFTFFVSEVVRGTVLSVPRGQIDAARSIGLSFWRRVRLVILPIASRAAIPPLINLAIILVKGTSYASVISVWELTTASSEVAQRTIAPFQVYGFALLIYFVICFGLTSLARYAEARLSFQH